MPSVYQPFRDDDKANQFHMMCTCRSCKQTSKDVQRQVAQLIMLNGMATDANQPGVEKLAATFLVPSWLLSPALDIDMEDGGAYLGPQKIFMVKGWTRAVCCLTVAYALMDCPGLLQVGIGNMFLYYYYYLLLLYIYII